MELNDREKLLIQNALFIMECQTIGDDMDYEIKQEIAQAGGNVTMEEIRELMRKVM